MQTSTLSRQTVLDHIKAAPNGLTFTEIQRFVVEAHGLDYDEKVVSKKWTTTGLKDIKVRKHRGWWCANLLGSCNSPYTDRVGILQEYCVKEGKRYKVK